MRRTAIGGTAAGVSIILIHLAPLSCIIMVGTLLLLTATVVLPAVWSSKKYRREAAYALLKLVIDPKHPPKQETDRPLMGSFDVLGPQVHDRLAVHAVERLEIRTNRRRRRLRGDTARSSKVWRQMYGARIR